jgi:hypothetical protein
MLHHKDTENTESGLEKQISSEASQRRDYDEIHRIAFE